MIDLLELSGRHASERDVEGIHGIFRLPTPWIAPEAFLHILFKAPDRVDLRRASSLLALPKVLIDFYSRQNGALLFDGALCIYGVRKVGQLMNRHDTFARVPFSIEQENEAWDLRSERRLRIGSYSVLGPFDGAAVCIDRLDLTISVIKSGLKTASRSWPSLDSWITGEFARLDALFSDDGLLLAMEEDVGCVGGGDVH